MLKASKLIEFSTNQKLFTSEDVADQFGIGKHYASSRCSKLRDLEYIKAVGKAEPPNNNGKRLILWQWIA